MIEGEESSQQSAEAARGGTSKGMWMSCRASSFWKAEACWSLKISVWYLHWIKWMSFWHLLERYVAMKQLSDAWHDEEKRVSLFSLQKKKNGLRDRYQSSVINDPGPLKRKPQKLTLSTAFANYSHYFCNNPHSLRKGRHHRKVFIPLCECDKK